MTDRGPPLSDEPLSRVLERLAARTPAPGAGSAAAIACSLAAGLVEMAARFDPAAAAAAARRDPAAAATAEARVARAARLRARALELAERELGSYAPVLEALAMDAEDPRRGERLAAARAAASGAPLAIAGVGAQLAELAAECVAGGSRHLVGEAVVAAELAEGACRAAAHLVSINLDEAPGDGDASRDARRAEVAEHVRTAAGALESALAGAAAR